MPTYAEFPAEPVSVAAPAPADLASHPMARRYRTVLTHASRGGPDFAGHYTIVRFGCGTSCVQLAVLDVLNGQVFFSKNLEFVQWAGWWHDVYGPQFRLDSRLLVVHGMVGESGRYGVSYFLWDGREFGRLSFVPQDPGPRPE